MQLKFNRKSTSGFYAEVRQEVGNYFETNNISRNANTAMVLKTILFLGGLVALYFLIVFGQFNLGVTYALAILIGMAQAFIGFNVAHDAIHGSYSANQTVNKLLSYTFNLMGANAYVWQITHNVVHHTYTNIPGHDEDLDVAPGLLRLSRLEEKKPIMKYQHLYAFPLYGLASLSWVFRKDFVKFFQDKIGQTDNTNHPRKEYFILFFSKALYYSLFIVVPLVVMDITWWMHTTANFSRNNKLAAFFCGGLNFQVEHHLFANICHIHYPALSPIVERVALKHGVPYHNNPTFFDALASHYRILKKMGQEDEEELVVPAAVQG